MKRLFPVFLLLIWFGCDTPQTGDVDPPVTFNPETHMLLEVTEKGYEMQIPVPLNITANYIPVARFNSSTGVLEVEAGPGFQLEIIEDEVDLAKVRASLQEDQLFSWNIQDETGDGFIAQAVLPNGQNHYFQFFHILTATGRTYLVRSREGMNFNLTDVRTMRQSVEAIQVNG